MDHFLQFLKELYLLENNLPSNPENLAKEFPDSFKFDLSEELDKIGQKAVQALNQKKEHEEMSEKGGEEERLPSRNYVTCVPENQSKYPSAAEGVADSLKPDFGSKRLPETRVEETVKLTAEMFQFSKYNMRQVSEADFKKLEMLADKIPKKWQEDYAIEDLMPLLNSFDIKDQKKKETLWKLVTMKSGVKILSKRPCITLLWLMSCIKFGKPEPECPGALPTEWLHYIAFDVPPITSLIDRSTIGVFVPDSVLQQSRDRLANVLNKTQGLSNSKLDSLRKIANAPGFEVFLR